MHLKLYKFAHLLDYAQNLACKKLSNHFGLPINMWSYITTTLASENESQVETSGDNGSAPYFINEHIISI